MCIMYRLIIALLGLTITQNGTQVGCAHRPSPTLAHSTTSTTAGTMVSNNTYEVSETNTTPLNDVNKTTSQSVSASTSITTSTVITTENESETTITFTGSLNETTTVAGSTSTTQSLPPITTDTNTALPSKIPEAGNETTTLPVSEFTSNAVNKSDSTSGTATSRSSIILYLACGSAAVFVVMIVVGVIVIIRYKRRINRLKTSIEGTERNSKRKRRRSSTDLFGNDNMGMHGIVNTAYDLQTVAYIPRITRGSVEYAVPVPPGNYSSVFTPYDRAVESNNDASAVETKPKGLFKSGFKLSNDEEDTCHPYFRLEPEAANESSTDTTFRVANYNTDVAQSNTDLPMHVYNHIKLGQGNPECDGDSSVLCSDQYSHISISDDTASGKRQYYNMVSIQEARIESVDNYSHVGPNNTRINKHVHRDDYDHVAM